MRHFIPTTRIVTVAAAVLVCASLCQAGHKPGHNPGGGGPGGAAAFALVDLGEHQSVAVALSEADGDGNVLVGGMTWFPDPYPVLWEISAGGSFDPPLYLGLPPGASEASIKGMNDGGVITLSTQGAGSGWYLAPGGAYEQVPFPGTAADALGINNFGDIVGEADFITVGGGWEGAVWLSDNGEFLGPIALGEFRPRDINDFGLMVGDAYNTSAERGEAALAWFNGNGELQVELLGVLPGKVWSEASAVSSNGEWVAGSSQGSAFVWSASTGLIGLGTLGGRDSVAFDVNSSGQVVGWTDTGGGKHSQTAFLWQNGTMFDLNDLVDTRAHLQWARCINNAGHIGGHMDHPKPISEQHGFLLIPWELLP